MITQYHNHQLYKIQLLSLSQNGKLTLTLRRVLVSLLERPRCYNTLDKFV